MEKIVSSGLVYYEINLGAISIISFDPQELIQRMISLNLSLN